MTHKLKIKLKIEECWFIRMFYLEYYTDTQNRMWSFKKFHYPKF